MTVEATRAPWPTIRRARLDEIGRMLAFAAGLEQPRLPPLTESLGLPPALVLLALQGDEIVGLLRIEGERRVIVTHLLIAPAVRESGAASALLVRGMWLCWAGGATEIGGFVPTESPLVSFALELGAKRGPLFQWFAGPLDEGKLFSDPLLSYFNPDAALLAELEAVRRRHLPQTEKSCHEDPPPIRGFPPRRPAPMITPSNDWAPFRDTFLIGFSGPEAEALRRIGWRLCQLAATSEYLPEYAPTSSLLAEQMAAVALDLRQVEALHTELAATLDPDLVSRLTAWCHSAARRIEDRLELLLEQTRA